MKLFNTYGKSNAGVVAASAVLVACIVGFASPAFTGAAVPPLFDSLVPLTVSSVIRRTTCATAWPTSPDGLAAGVFARTAFRTSCRLVDRTR